jgi:hypothetical protein
MFYCTILLAAPPLPSRHGFRAQCPPTFLSLLCCITSSLLAILHCPFSLSVSLVEPHNVPQVDFFVFGSRPVAYFGLLHELEHVHYSIICEQDFEVSSVWHFADCDVFGFQLLHHGLPFPAPLSTFEQEVRDGLSAFGRQLLNSNIFINSHQNEAVKAISRVNEFLYLLAYIIMS